MSVVMLNSTEEAGDWTSLNHSESNTTVKVNCNVGFWIYGPEFMILKYAMDVFLMPVLIVGGAVGNALSFWVLQSMKGATTTVVLQALAVADTLYLLNCFFFQTLKTLYTYNANFAAIFPSFPYWEARMAWPLGNTTQTLAVWLVVLLTAERYCAICFPLKSKQLLTRGRNRVWIVTVCCLALIFNAPTHLDLRVFDIPNHEKCPNIRPKEAFPSRLFNHVYYNVFYKTVACFLFRTLGPVCILIILNIKLVKTLEISKSQTNQVTSRTSNNMSEIVIIVVCAFLTCQTPDVVFRFLRAVKYYAPTYVFDWHVFAYLATFTNFLVALNSAINFLLYCVSGGRFRHILRKNLGCVKKKKRHSEMQPGRSRTPSRTLETFLSLVSLSGAGSRNASALDISKDPEEQKTKASGL